MKSNWQYLVLAFALAVFSWYLVSGREKVDAWIQMPVEMVNVPQGYVVRKGMINRIEVLVRGPRPIVRGIDMKSAVYPLNLAGLTAGENVLSFESSQIGLSRAIEVVEIVPPRVELIVDRLISKAVPVIVDYEFELHEDYELKQLILDPPTVSLRGPETVVDPVQEVSTKTVGLDKDRPDTWETVAGLLVPVESEASPARVALQFIFGEKTEEKWLEADVRVPEMEGRSVRVKPEKVRLLLQLPVSMARDEELAGKVHVALEGVRMLEPGAHTMGFRARTPAGAALLEADPEVVEVVIVQEVEEQEEQEEQVQEEQAEEERVESRGQERDGHGQRVSRRPPLVLADHAGGQAVQSGGDCSRLDSGTTATISSNCSKA